MIKSEISLTIEIPSEDAVLHMILKTELPFLPHTRMYFHAGEGDDFQQIRRIVWLTHEQYLEIELAPLIYDSVGDLQHYYLLLRSEGWVLDENHTHDSKARGYLNQLNPHRN